MGSKARKRAGSVYRYIRSRVTTKFKREGDFFGRDLSPEFLSYTLGTDWEFTWG